MQRNGFTEIWTEIWTQLLVYMFLSDFHIRGEPEGYIKHWHEGDGCTQYKCSSLQPPISFSIKIFFFNQDFKMHLHPCRHDWKSWNHRINPLMNRIKFPQAFHSFHPRAIWCFKLRNELSHTCFHAKYQSLRISLITVLVWSLLAIHYSENEYFRDTWGDVSCSQLCVKFP